MIVKMLKARWPVWAFLLLTLSWEAAWAFGFRKECSPSVVLDAAPTLETCRISFPAVYVGHSMYWVFGPWRFALVGPLIIGVLVILAVTIARLVRLRHA
jgi:hypothetical protein